MLHLSVNPKRFYTDLFHAQFLPGLFSRMIHKSGRLVQPIVQGNSLFSVMGQETCQFNRPTFILELPAPLVRRLDVWQTYQTKFRVACTSAVQSATQAAMLCLIVTRPNPIIIVIDDTACSIMPPAHLVSNKKLAFWAQ